MENLKPWECPEDEDATYLIKKGEALIVRQLNKGYIELCLLGANDMIGYIPFLNTSHEPHSASVYVSGDFECTAIGLTEIRKEYRQMSQTFKNLIKHTTTSISMTTGRLFDVIKSGQLDSQA